MYPKTPKRVHIIQTHVELELLKSLMLRRRKSTRQNSLLTKWEKLSKNEPPVSGSRVRACAHIRDFALFAFTTFTQGEMIVAVVKWKSRSFNKKCRTFSGKSLRVLKQCPRKVGKAQKSPNMFARDWDKHIFTSSSFGKRLSPFQTVFLPVFRVAVTILWNSVQK